MSKDISSMYTKERNSKTGRKGYGMWKREKEDVISPANYGGYLIQKKGKRK